jgi:DNA polymerase IIIc chi subunit
LQFNPALGEIHISLSARGERHSFWIDLNTEDYVAAIEDMLEVFDGMAKEATKPQNAKKRKSWRKRNTDGNPNSSA